MYMSIKAKTSYFLKKNLVIIFLSPIYVNFLLNILLNKSLHHLFGFENLIRIMSLFLQFYFFFLLGKTIMKSINIDSPLLSLTYFLSSFYIIDMILLPFTKSLNSKFVFLIVVFSWILIFILKLDNKKYVLYTIASWFLLNFFNREYFSVLKENNFFKELNTDVTVQWLPLAEMIFANNYFYAFQNNLIEGQSLLPTYIQTVIFRLNFFSNDFIFIQGNANIFIVFGVLLIFDLKIKYKNKLITTFILLSLILNNEWLFYLLGNSLMIEGIVAILVGVYVINLGKFMKESYPKKYFFFIFFGTLLLTKQFVSLLSLCLIFIILLFNKDIKILISGLFLFLMNSIYKLLFLGKVNHVTYAEDLDLKELFFDLILFRNLSFNNANQVFKNIFIDIPLTYLMLVFMISFLFSYFTKSSVRFETFTMFFLVILNFGLIIILYISYWKNIEVQSSYRYFINMFYLLFGSTIINLNSLERVE